MDLTSTERKELAAQLDGMRTSIELYLRPYSRKAQDQFMKSDRRAWFTSEDIEALKAAATWLRAGTRTPIGGEQ